MNINMKSLKKSAARGFTLIELMIVVAIIGILAVIAVVGVRKYLANAKSAEARQGIGAITRGAVQAYEKESTAAEALALGTTSVVATRALCGTAVTTPVTPPAGKKYQPNNVPGSDFNTGDGVSGWKCLKFSMESPINYAYSYTKGTNPLFVAAGGPAVVGTESFEAAAQGDLNANAALSTFAMAGQQEPTTGEVRVFTQIIEKDPEE